jgi:TIR domain/CHASE2 domain
VGARGAAAHDLIVVTFPSFAGEWREDVRRGFAFLIRKAVENEARGIAFDYYLERESLADPLLALVIGQAEKAGVPVFFGYKHDEVDGLIVRRPIAPSLAEALPLERLGHLAGYLEYDDRVRLLPVNLAGFGALSSFSSKIATALADGEVRMPKDDLVKFTEPLGGVHVEQLETGAAPALDWRLWRDRFIVVGTRQPSDLRTTPFGVLPGVVIHAYAAHSLRTGCFIYRLDPRWTFPVIFLVCYLLTIMEVRGVPSRSMLAAAGLLSLAVLGAAALAMRYLLVWIDVRYPLAAIWLLTGLQLAMRALRSALRRRAAAPAADGLPRRGTNGTFDVFLSHNGKDKPAVKGIGEALEARGLKPWLDEWELVPGRPWQEALEGIILTVRSSAVFVGRDGLGPWEVPEMRASLSECVRRGLPVIPVLLPGAGAQPTLPLFLTQYTWVDFRGVDLRGGVSEEILDRLVWGITGVKPAKRA